MPNDIQITITGPVYVYAVPKRLADIIEAIPNTLSAILLQGKQAMAAIDDAITALTGQVTQEVTVEQSAITLINGIPALIAAAIAANPGNTAAQVTAINAAVTKLQASATSLGTAVAANTPAATIPSALTATATAGQIALAFTGVANATSYNIYRGTTAGGEGTTAIGSSPTNSYTDSTVTSAQAYFYVVTAVVNGSESADSAEATATAV